MIKFEKVSLSEFRKSFPTTDEKVLSEAYESIKLPERSTQNSAGYDFFMHSPLISNASVYPTGIKVKMPADTVLLLFPRSSLGFKNGFQLLNTVGVIDSDYYGNQSNEGHIKIGFKADHSISLKTGDKICQGIFVKFQTVDNDKADGERIGGIGSTGQ